MQVLEHSVSFLAICCSRCHINGCIRVPFPIAFELGYFQKTGSMVSQTHPVKCLDFFSCFSQGVKGERLFCNPSVDTAK